MPDTKKKNKKKPTRQKKMENVDYKIFNTSDFYYKWK